MKYIVFTVLLVCTATLYPFLAESAQSPMPGADLQCNTGPVSKAYGRRLWLVYSCEDNKSLAVVSAPGNPAFPFYFMFSPVGDKYEIHADGRVRAAGATEAVDAASTELRKLTPQDVRGLIEQSRHIK